MSKRTTMRHFRFVLGATFLALVVATTWAHEYSIRGPHDKPDDSIPVAPDTENTRTIRMSKGGRAILGVEDHSGCTAKISISDLAKGAGIKVFPDSSKGFVKDQDFAIEAKEPGTYTFNVKVLGEAANGGNEECDENSTNKIQVIVAPDPSQTEKEAEHEWKPMLRGMTKEVKNVVKETNRQVNRIRSDLRSGKTDPMTAIESYFEAYRLARITGIILISQTLRDFRNNLIQLMLDEGYTLGNEPRGFGVGGGGIWDRANSDASRTFDWFHTKLGQSLTKSVPKVEVDLRRLTDIVYRLAAWIDWCDCPCYSPPTLSEVFAPRLDDRTRLQAAFVGSASWREGGNPTGFIWAGGVGDPMKGDLAIDLEAGDGSTSSSTATIDSDNAWRVRIDLVLIGYLYRLAVNYAESTRRGERAYITVPKVQSDF